MGWLVTRYFLSLGNVAMSLLVAVLALALCAIYNEALLLQLLRSAAGVRDWLVTFQGWPKAELISRLVLHESSVLLMFFTLMARAVIGLFVLVVRWLSGNTS
jgi:hypothetical protein